VARDGRARHRLRGLPAPPSADEQAMRYIETLDPMLEELDDSDMELSRA
jgi:hypothetical protein